VFPLNSSKNLKALHRNAFKFLLGAFEEKMLKQGLLVVSSFSISL